MKVSLQRCRMRTIAFWRMSTHPRHLSLLIIRGESGLPFLEGHLVQGRSFLSMMDFSADWFQPIDTAGTRLSKNGCRNPRKNSRKTDD